MFIGAGAFLSIYILPVILLHFCRLSLSNVDIIALSSNLIVGRKKTIIAGAVVYFIALLIVSILTYLFELTGTEDLNLDTIEVIFWLLRSISRLLWKIIITESPFNSGACT